MKKTVPVQLLEGMDGKEAKKIARLELEDGMIYLLGSFGAAIAKLKVSSIEDAKVRQGFVSAGLFKKEKAAQVMDLIYTTKAGEKKTLTFLPGSEAAAHLFCASIHAAKAEAILSSIPAQVNPSASSKPSQNSSDLVTERIHVRGESFYEESFNELRYKNYEYDYSKKEIIEEGLDGHRIYQYEFDPVNVELIDEPDNPKDPNAIAVYVCGHQIGYVPHGSTAHIRNVREKYGIQRITAEMGGGKYKIVFEDDDNEGSYSMDHGEAPNWAIVSISYRKTEKSEES